MESDSSPLPPSYSSVSPVEPKKEKIEGMRVPFQSSAPWRGETVDDPIILDESDKEQSLGDLSALDSVSGSPELFTSLQRYMFEYYAHVWIILCTCRLCVCNQ